MIRALLNLALHGCAHRRTTFPQTSGKRLNRTYVVCLDCGTEFGYDWRTMRRGAAVRTRHGQTAAPPALLRAPDYEGRFST
ncbi:MAG TPA: hypothetical protein VMI94_05715 [Bryobacteraceae bacterium]|nr:hypothetical protein [Bryobacteraceae bacterium]